MKMYCYICREQFVESSLIIPINMDINLPYGRFVLNVYMHYMCGLNYYLDNLKSVAKLTDKDKTDIIGKLMEVMNGISDGSVQ
jgi:hypothetical protein